MKINGTYFTLQLKKLCQFLPKLIAGTIVLATLAGAIAFYGANFLYGQTSAQKISIAIVIEDDSTLMKLIMKYLESSDSVHSFCRFVTTTQENADNMLAKQQIAASIYFPKNFARDIVTGKNTPAIITFSKETGIEQLLFQELTAAASRILNYAQASIYSFSDIYDEYYFREKRSVHYDYINENTMETALVRSDFFKVETVSSTGSLSVKDYYTVTAVLLLLFLTGISLGQLARPKSGSLARILTLKGLSAPIRTIWKLAALFIFYIILGGLILLAGWICKLFTWELFLVLPCLALLVSSQTLFLFSLTSGDISGTLLVFFYTLLSVLSSGCLIPAAFLPQTVISIGKLFPAFYAHKLLSLTYTASVSFVDCIPVLVISILFLALSCLGALWVERRTS